MGGEWYKVYYNKSCRIIWVFKESQSVFVCVCLYVCMQKINEIPGLNTNDKRKIYVGSIYYYELSGE